LYIYLYSSLAVNRLSQNPAADWNFVKANCAVGKKFHHYPIEQHFVPLAAASEQQPNQELLTAQSKNKADFYQTNASYWEAGVGTTNNDEAMIGDGNGEEDGREGLEFLDKLLASSCVASTNKTNTDRAVDLGAGVGRVTKLVLLKRHREVRLVEADAGWSKRSKAYLGRKRASRCSFVHQRLDDLTLEDIRNWGPPAGVMWIQWTLQYMIDVDVVSSLIVLATGLRPKTGVLVVKENRPYGTAREDRFQMDMPGGENERYDITRTDAHHRLLFHNAGLRVVLAEKGAETHTYALMI